MKQYDLTVIIHPDLEMNMQPALDKVVKLIESVGGKITNEDNEGKKHMSYKIEGQEFGLYYSYALDLPVDAPEKMERQLAIFDEVIRHLLVKKDPKAEKMAERRKELEAKREAMGASDETEEDTTNNDEEEK